MLELPDFIKDRAFAESPLFTADEVAGWPAGLLDDLLGQRILVVADNAQSITCDSCADDHIERVEYLPPGSGDAIRTYINCPSSGRVEVQLSRLRQWRLTDAFIKATRDVRRKQSPRWREDLEFGEELNRRLYSSIAAQDLAGVLGILATDIERWSRRVKVDLFDYIHDDKDAADRQMCNPLDGSPFRPFVFVRPLIGQSESIDMLEIHFDVQFAERFGSRLNAFNNGRCNFADLVCEYDARFGSAMELEDFLVLDGQRKALKQIGFTLVEHIALVKSQVSDQTSQPIKQRSQSAKGQKSGVSNKGSVPKQSWTQADLDQAIREYKAKRASTYNDLVVGAKWGKAGAKKSARDLFGRNAIVRALGVKSAAMVSGSSVWQSIADELRLRGRSRSTSTQKSQRIGLDISLEDQAVASSAPILDHAIQLETTRLIEKSMPANEAEATIEKLRRGEITDDKARELVEVFAQQQRDQRTRKVRQMP